MYYNLRVVVCNLLDIRYPTSCLNDIRAGYLVSSKSRLFLLRLNRQNWPTITDNRVDFVAIWRRMREHEGWVSSLPATILILRLSPQIYRVTHFFLLAVRSRRPTSGSTECECECAPSGPRCYWQSPWGDLWNGRSIAPVMWRKRRVDMLHMHTHPHFHLISYHCM